MNVVTEDLPRSPDSVATARRIVHGEASMLAPQQRADAVLMVSELVTNALRHGTGTISLRIDTQPDRLRVEVSDEGDVALKPNPTPGADGGWGLRIVETLADAWGVTDGSTKVWFRLDGPHEAP